MFLVVAAGLSWWIVTRSGCRHVDEAGRSVLTWERTPGRVRGRCADCGRLTRGWDVPWRAAYKTPKYIRRGVFALLPFSRKRAA